MQTTAVVGAGTMGRGIAQVFLQSGMEVVLIDRSEEQLEKAIEDIKAGLEKFREKEKIEEDPEEIIERLDANTAMAEVEGAELILEAVSEKEEIKREVYQEAAKHNKSAVYASNTSSIPIKKLAEHAPDPEKFIGMHFFNPAPIMDIVEVVKTEETSKEVENEVLE
ncbi:MAG: 3-hydroxyacyl-CoA dehydrogenase NAD-binding domain-containing protein, partial [Candidatus Nanohaloarchaea archaeon]|nr:3-hydroxyacyl-CoA dehydrogenase NAD-binding domain-containing protein [Candidatus Nanohaloarchaea archaeon]